MKRQQAIGIIDSGVGGLTVAREILRQLPHEQIIYVGDNARCPYGSRPTHEIRAFSFQLIQFLQNLDVKALVIACNTAGAVIMDELYASTNLPAIGVIEPGARAAIAATRSGRIGVIGTETTIRTAAYERALKRMNPELTITSLACPAFVPLVEQQLLETVNAHDVIESTLSPLKREQLDTLILGCTHYPLLAPLIQDVLGASVTLINSAEETARELTDLFTARALHTDNASAEPVHQFFTSGDTHIFQEIGEQWLGREIRVQSLPTAVSQMD